MEHAHVLFNIFIIDMDRNPLEFQVAGHVNIDGSIRRALRTLIRQRAQTSLSGLADRLMMRHVRGFDVSLTSEGFLNSAVVQWHQTVRSSGTVIFAVHYLIPNDLESSSNSSSEAQEM